MRSKPCVGLKDPNLFFAVRRLLAPAVSPPPEAGKSVVEEQSNLVTRRYQTALARDLQKKKLDLVNTETLNASFRRRHAAVGLTAPP